MRPGFLSPPIQDVYINQRFGENQLDYQSLGLAYHNGIDFKAKTGCPVRAAHSGVIMEAFNEKYGGLTIVLWNRVARLKTAYCHLSKITVSVAQIVGRGMTIGLSGNTGIFTTGPHLHFGLKETDGEGDTINKNNGVFGAINPHGYFEAGYDEAPALKRYGRARTWASFLTEKKTAASLRSFLKRWPTNEEINAAVYGGWGREEIRDPAMRYVWLYRKKYDDNHNDIFLR